jgi:DNA segregation ATPase FtsK/SpoIIIE, S-DNA-T family
MSWSCSRSTTVPVTWGSLRRSPIRAPSWLAGDRARQVWLIRHLRDELERRRGAAATRRTVVMIDNLAAMRAEFDDVEGMQLMDGLTRVYADGHAVGIWFAVTADRLTTVPGAWGAVTTQK